LNKPISNLFSNYIETTSYEQLPSQVIREVKRRILDFLGVTLCGSETLESKIIADFVMSMGGREESTIIGHHSKVPCINAGLVNGVTGHVIELDDIHTTAIFHPAVTIISTALSLGEREKTDGRELITAIALGYDVGIILGTAINPSHRFRGFHTTGTCGTLAAAATAGKILKLKRNKMNNAFGLATTQASGLLELKSMGKRLNPGKATQNGIVAALLAQKGFTSSASIDGSEKGFCKAFSDNYVLEDLEGKLGKVFMILETDVKVHACCGMFHSAIDALLNILQNEGLDYRKIKKIVVRTFQAAIDVHGEREPDSRVAATMSLPYSLAVASVRGQAGFNEFKEDVIKDTEILELTKKVEMVNDPDLEKLFPETWPALVSIQMKNGTKFESYVEKPKGFYPDKPLSDAEFKRKFKSLTLMKLEENIDDIISTVWRLEELTDVSGLMSLFSTR
jgi:2-methylcitrate dehydratase PrpD